MPTVKIMVGDVLARLGDLPDKSVHCCVTSPPYWGLRDYDVDGQIGLEPTVEEYIEKLTTVFAEVWRVLRDDGTLWLNMGDSYFGGGCGARDEERWPKQSRNDHRVEHSHKPRKGKDCDPKRGAAADGQPLKFARGKAKDMVGQPWRLAFALQAAGWYIRSDIIWHKPNPMPESCADRPTQSHEYIFLLTKKPRYFYDAEAVKEKSVTAGQKHDGRSGGRNGYPTKRGFTERVDTGTRNLRNVWKMATQAYPDAHFATFPHELPRKCILAGTSKVGCCPECGAPITRVVEKVAGTSEPVRGWDSGPGAHGRECRPEYRGKHAKAAKRSAGRRILKGMADARAAGADHDNPFPQTRTVGWKATCECLESIDYTNGSAYLVPCTVLDPFGGAGTTALVAAKMGRSAILTELSPKYANMAADRIRRECALLATVTVDELTAENVQS